jgi:3-oxoisoapionate kinase
VVLMDVLSPEQEPSIGEVLWGQVREDATLFVVGSSGVEYSLTAYWKSRGMLPEPPAFGCRPVTRIVVASGSCSPVTDRQIGWAVQHGAAEVALNTSNLVDPATAGVEIDNAAARVKALYDSGKMVICHTARGPSDARRDETNRRIEALGGDAKRDSGRLLGEAVGDILLRVLQDGSVTRTVFTGGDTSFFAARRLRIESLEMIAPVAPGSPLCRARVPGAAYDGIEVCFKGGQVGREDFFGTVLNPGEQPRDV